MSRYKTARHDRRDRAKSQGLTKILAVVIALLALVGLYLWTVSDRRALDPQTLCPPGEESITVLLVDVTDPLTLPQRQDFVNQLERLRTSIPRYGKLAIYKVDATSEQLLQPVIERCNPGTAADVSEWTGNPQATENEWREGFERPLDQAFLEITQASSADRSPIIESVQSIALTELTSPQAEGKPRQLIIASDLLQNTDRITFYERLPAAEQLIASDAFRMLRTDLRDIEVELWMLQRPDSQQSQPRELINLWELIIREQGGDVTRVYNVSG